MTYVLGVELSFCRCCVKMSGFGELLEHNTKLPYSVISVSYTHLTLPTNREV